MKRAPKEKVSADEIPHVFRVLGGERFAKESDRDLHTFVSFLYMRKIRMVDVFTKLEEKS